MVNKAELTSNLDIIKEQFLSSQTAEVENAEFRVSKAGNLVWFNRIKRTMSVYEVDLLENNKYIFKELSAYSDDASSKASNKTPKSKKVSFLTDDEKDVAKSIFFKRYRLFNSDNFKVDFDRKCRITVEECKTGKKNKYKIKRESFENSFSFSCINANITELNTPEAHQIVNIFFARNPKLNRPFIRASVTCDATLNLNYTPGDITVVYGIRFCEENGYDFTLQKQFAKAFSVIEEAIEFEKYKNVVFKKACELVSRCWAFTEGKVEVSNYSFRTTRFSAQIRWGRSYESVSINRNDYRDEALTPEQNVNRLAELFMHRVEALVNNALPQKVIDSIAKAVKRQKVPEVNFGATVKKLLFIQSSYSGQETLFALGASDKKDISSLRRQTNGTLLSYKYDPALKLFVANSKIYTYYLSPDNYTVEKVEINKSAIEKIRTSAEVYKKKLPYYELALSFIGDIKKSGCVIKGLDYSGESEGIFYSNTNINLSYNDHAFTVNVSVPHFPYTDGEDHKAEIKTDFKSVLKTISDKKAAIDNELDEYRRSNLDIYQSFAAQTICDFINAEPSSCSITRIIDVLTKKSCNDCSAKNKKYVGILNGYSKEYVRSVVDKLEHAGLIRSYVKHGAYTNYTAYKPNPHCNEYKFYFNNKVRAQKDIINDLKSGIGVPRHEACLVLGLIKEGKIKEKDFVYVFNIFKNHDFVIRHQEDITEAFSEIPQNIKLYIPFVVDEYPRASAERKVLKSIQTPKSQTDSLGKKKVSE